MRGGAVMDKDELKQHFSEKTRDLGVQICTITADNILLAVWIIVESTFERYVVPRFPLTSELSLVCFFIFRIIFAFSTLCPPLIYLYRDVHTIWLKAQAAIKQERAAVNARPEEAQK
jgi:hypothetical protein